MRILVVGGTHGDEETGIKTVSLLKRKLITGIDALIANPRATKLHQRFTESDLNRSFGVQNPRTYEERRAVHLIEVLKQYDLIIDFHNTVSRTTCAILTVSRPTWRQLQVATHLGMNRVVIMPPGHSLAGQNPSKTLGLEISTSDKEFSASFLVDRIKSISQEAKNVDSTGLTIYRYGGIKVGIENLASAGLKSDEFADFHPISKEKLKLLSLSTKAQVPFLVREPAYGKGFAFKVAEIIKKGKGES
ncbi:MAG: succinylglutamate desuccinylase/aspartoacylase family protein [bacterium]|nr:succinylglutamate desuccinylase/aspartoacylase family protein [bacterium]